MNAEQGVTLTHWDRRYLRLAAHIRDWSKDPRGRVGAVIVAPELNRIVATGFNGFPTRIEDDMDRLSDKPTKLDMMVHAEQSALLFAGREARGCTLYVVGKPVCNHCAVLSIQSGIRRVVASPPRLGTRSEWDRRGHISARLFAEAGLRFDAVPEVLLAELLPGEAGGASTLDPTPTPSG
ncbi:deoxycytidylate deaminase [Roseomonas sp. SSH11]|uniref:Deoxycytidylate deaminase n=1 Tax=Pararoseomonas baculiformis TaxID=2820812 RepID=A0ABS4AB14_9PROT|nr:deaminase [Pararoseomonas baculiformis]MBP0444056.1 deoxycytidylate deaminase [Pararoseomonas baculiformis]